MVSAGEKVILVDEFDNAVGAEENLRSHLKGLLHRSLSVFIFNSRGDMLLQKRAAAAHPFGGLWSNACCSHPRPGEATRAAAHRRLAGEMGFMCPLREVFSLRRRMRLAGGMIEHEFDHVLVGEYDGEPRPRPAAVEVWKWMPAADLMRAVADSPAEFTPWLRLCAGRVFEARLQQSPCGLTT